MTVATLDIDSAVAMIAAGEAADVAEAVLLAGGDPGDADSLEAVRAALAPVGAPREPLLARFREVTGLQDHEVSQLVGVGRGAVQAIRTARCSESLRPAALRNLRAVLVKVAERCGELVADIDAKLAK